MSRSEQVAWCLALKLVPSRWRAEFVRFVEEGEAGEEFLALLEQEPKYRNACEMVLRADHLLTWALKTHRVDLPRSSRRPARSKPKKKETDRKADVPQD